MRYAPEPQQAERSQCIQQPGQGRLTQVKPYAQLASPQLRVSQHWPLRLAARARPVASSGDPVAAAQLQVLGALPLP